MKFFVGILLLALVFPVLFSCGGKTPDVEENSDSMVVDSDSVLSQEDSLEMVIEKTPVPKAADEYFNDFFYSFTSRRKYQMARIVFPLLYENMGKQTYIQPSQWKFTRMHTKNDFYSVFFDNEGSLKLEKSRKVAEVTIDNFNMEQGTVKSYYFSRQEDQWKLRKMCLKAVNSYEDAGFMRFFHQFCTDSVFQREHLCAEIDYSGPDPDDDFETLTGTIVADQWDAFRPALPAHEFTNIEYGQQLKNKKQRVVALEGASNGFLSLLFFRQTGNVWKLYKLKG